eukprot:922685-Pelagomonas_calceolata.AAC.6
MPATRPRALPGDGFRSTGIRGSVGMRAIKAKDPVGRKATWDKGLGWLHVPCSLTHLLGDGIGSKRAKGSVGMRAVWPKGSGWLHASSLLTHLLGNGTRSKRPRVHLWHEVQQGSGVRVASCTL